MVRLSNTAPSDSDVDSSIGVFGTAGTPAVRGGIAIYTKYFEVLVIRKMDGSG